MREAGLRRASRKIQTLPPIEFFMGTLAGGLLGYFVAIMVSG
jgi:hypothetical protein